MAELNFKEASQSYISKTKVVNLKGGSETCFRISLDPKMTSWKQKEVYVPLNQDFYKHTIFTTIFINFSLVI